MNCEEEARLSTMYLTRTAENEVSSNLSCLCCRPLRLEGAYVLLAAHMDARRPTRMHISMRPQDDEAATLLLATNDRHLATADVPAPKVSSHVLQALASLNLTWASTPVHGKRLLFGNQNATV